MRKLAGKIFRMRLRRWLFMVMVSLVFALMYIAASAQKLVPATTVPASATASNSQLTAATTVALTPQASASSSAVLETITLRGLNNEVLRDYQVDNGDEVGRWKWTKDYIYAGSNLLASESPNGIRHYHVDHLGTTRVITDAAGNSISTPYEYFPFGDEATAQPPDDERFRFTGHERDLNDPLKPDYMHARFYYRGGSAGKFLSVDPGRDWDLKNPQSWNLYSYVQNNPLNNVDPDGRFMNPAFMAAAAAAASSQKQFSLFDNNMIDFDLSHNPNMTISQAALNALKIHEGHATNGYGAYNDPSGYCTIGFGHLLHGRSSCTSADCATYRNFSLQQAETLLRQDLASTERAVNDLVKAPLTQAQFDGLVTFTFNFNPGVLSNASFLTPLNLGLSGAVPDGMAKFNKSRVNGQLVVMPGLVTRRAAEGAPFVRTFHLWQ